MDASKCVVLVPFQGFIHQACDVGLRGLERRGYQVRRVGGYSAIDLGRSVIASAALRDGFEELMWVDSDVGFDPADVDKLRGHGLPLVCGVYPKKGLRQFACDFLPKSEKVVFGRGGGLTEIRYAGFGFVLVRRAVFDRVRVDLRLPDCNQRFGPPVVPYFLPAVVPDGDGLWYLAEDYAFCERARRCGFRLMADTTIRLVHDGGHGFTWEDAGAERPKYDTYVFTFPRPGGASTPAQDSPPQPAGPAPSPLRREAGPLPAGFPRLRAYVVTYPANHESLAQTLDSLRASDWGEDPVILTQPADWPEGRESAARNYKRALEQAVADGCDFALLLEDDIRVCRHLRHNLSTLPLVARDQCDYLSLYIPDLIADPWDRAEPHLGYRLAKPLYAGPNKGWERHRLWGAQAYLLSRRLVLAALDRWDRMAESQDTRVLTVCAEFRVPLWYTAPCLVDHAPVRSAFGTPAARAPDFDPDFRLAVGTGFQPPEAVPGGLGVDEGRALWEAAADRAVLELGFNAGRGTVCLAQQARRAVAAGPGDPAEAAEWVNRFGLVDRVEFRPGDPDRVLGEAAGGYGLVVVDPAGDAERLARDLGPAARAVGGGGLLAVLGYPDPQWPDIRRVVDDQAGREGWVRVVQAGYLGLFRTSTPATDRAEKPAWVG